MIYHIIYVNATVVILVGLHSLEKPKRPKDAVVFLTMVKCFVGDVLFENTFLFVNPTQNGDGQERKRN